MLDISTALSNESHAIDEAARFVGGRASLAEILGVRVAALGNWKTRGVPIERCVPIERVTAGAVTRRDLRPDDWQEIWPELASTPITITEPATEGG